MRSLYHGYPVGALLVWETEGSAQAVRGGNAGAGQRLLLLDGQQRVTTLYGIIRGKAPAFFEGDRGASLQRRGRVLPVLRAGQTGRWSSRRCSSAAASTR
ncbi:DUF262 domain-containing protein [Pseudonocardia sulfidoxydans]|nr:DUF262 domain-containing protein [Pseudonocardia sulfidoxydans]